MKGFRQLLFLIITLSLGTLFCSHVGANAAGDMDAYGRLPVSFVENHGQVDSRASFVICGPQGSAFFTNDTVVFRLRECDPSDILGDLFPMLGNVGAERMDRWPASHERHSRSTSSGMEMLDRLGRAEESSVLGVVFVDASSDLSVEGCGELPGKVNYLIGDNELKWRKNIPTFGGVAYRNVWPGIDVIYRGEGKRLKYDIQVTAGADIGRIGLRYEGADEVSLTESGDLVITAAGASFKETRPGIYQEKDGERVWLDGGFTVDADTVGFTVEGYDPALPLVIDPASDLIWSTFLGGSVDEAATSIAVDSSGCAYVSGWTQSSGFPTTSGVYDSTFNGFDDIFVAKLNAGGTALVYSTFIGGATGSDASYAMALDSSGCVYVAGGTNSSDYPATSAAYDKTYNGNWDCIVAKLSADGSSLLYSTYLGGAVYMDNIQGIALDSSGVYVAGYTCSSDFPSTSGAYQTSWNAHYSSGIPLPDAFVAKLSSDLSSLVYSTFLGGATSLFPQQEEADGIAVDSAGCAYVTGVTYATDFPTTTGALRTAHHGFSPFDCFVTKLNSSGSGLVYSTFLGGTASTVTSPQNFGYAIALDSSGRACVTGMTTTVNFPTTAGAFDTVFNGFGNVFVSKLDSSGSALVGSTLLSGTTNYDHGRAIALDSSDSIYVTGFAQSTDFPTTLDACDRSFNGGNQDVFVAKFNPTCSGLVYCTLLGGSSDEAGLGITVDAQNCAYLAGATCSSNFPTTPAAYDTSWNGGTTDAFAAKLQLTPPTSVSSAKLLANTVSVARTWGIVTLATYVAPAVVYYIESEDRSCGIRIEDLRAAALTPSIGDRVDIAGALKTNSDLERYIDVSSFFRNGTGSVSPLAMTNRDIGGADWNYNPDPSIGSGQKGVLGGTGLNNIGLLITTTGTVTASGTDPAGNNYFYVDDGCALADVSGLIGVRVMGTVPHATPIGRVVTVTGVSSCYKSGSNLYRLILTRSQSDVVVLS